MRGIAPACILREGVRGSVRDTRVGSGFFCVRKSRELSGRWLPNERAARLFLREYHRRDFVAHLFVSGIGWQVGPNDGLTQVPKTRLWLHTGTGKKHIEIINHVVLAYLLTLSPEERFVGRSHVGDRKTELQFGAGTFFNVSHFCLTSLFVISLCHKSLPLLC